MGLISRVSSRTYRIFKMATELESYEIQLEQVDLALSQDLENEELLALKEDLLQVINLTKQLESEQKEQVKQKAQQKSDKQTTESDKLKATYLPGQSCLAPWSKDGHYYRCVIDELLPGSTTVAVTFSDYNEKDLCKLEDLLPDTITNDDAPGSTGGKMKSALKNAGRKDWLQADKEKRKFKKEKKAAKLQEAIQAGETAKQGCQNFRKSKKARSGKIKKVGKDIDRSMFVSPENAMSSFFGSELTMTKPQKAAVYNARSLIPKQ